jgi:hypothetical protein
VSVWHGTTVDRACEIRLGGFRILDVASELAVVAAHYDVPVDGLREALATHHRFAAVQRERPNLVWLATSVEAAEHWAARAPELHWEALWAVWWTVRDSDDPTPWRSPKAAGWHAQQLFASAPAVVMLDIPGDRLLGPNGEALGPGDVSELITLGAPELSFRPPAESHWLKEVRKVRRPVEFTAVAGLLRMTLDELANAVVVGEIPPPHPGRPGMDQVWFQDDLPTFVPRELLETPL